MNQLSATSRRAVRTLAQGASIDWSRPVWSATPEVTAKFNNFKSWVAMADAMSEKYKTPPAPVDFAPTKKAVRDKELVESFEAFYKSAQPPVEDHTMPAEEQTRFEESIAYLTEMDAVQKEFIPVLENEIDFLKNNRVSEDTTVFDMQVAYPLIHEEIEDEIEAREWFKDTEYERKGGGDGH